MRGCQKGIYKTNKKHVTAFFISGIIVFPQRVDKCLLQVTVMNIQPPITLQRREVKHKEGFSSWCQKLFTTLKIAQQTDECFKRMCNKWLFKMDNNTVFKKQQKASLTDIMKAKECCRN